MLFLVQQQGTETGSDSKALLHPIAKPNPKHLTKFIYLQFFKCWQTNKNIHFKYSGTKVEQIVSSEGHRAHMPSPSVAQELLSQRYCMYPDGKEHKVVEELMVQMLVSKKLLGMMLIGGHEFGKHKAGHYTEAKLVKESCKVVGSHSSLCLIGLQPSVQQVCHQ